MVASGDRLFPRLFTPEISAFYEDEFAKVRPELSHARAGTGGPMLAVPAVAACYRLLNHAVPGVMRAVPRARRTASRSSRTTARCALWMPATGASARWS